MTSPTAGTARGSAQLVRLAQSAWAGGLIYALLVKALRFRTATRSAIFAIILTLLTLRGTSPSTALTLSLFLPLALTYGAVLDYAHRRRFARRTI